MGSAWGPSSSCLLLQSQQAVGDALLVAWQPHPDPLDVPGETGVRIGATSLEWGWEGLEPVMATPWVWGGPQEQQGGWTWLILRDGQTDTAHPEGWRKGHGSSQGMDGWTQLITASPATEHLILSHPLGHHGHASGFLSQHIPVPWELEGGYGDSVGTHPKDSRGVVWGQSGNIKRTGTHSLVICRTFSIVL